MKKQKQEPWEAMPHVWKTKPAFFAWLRGILRKGWNRHPAKLELLNKSRFQIPNPNPKGKKPTVWGHECSKCGAIGVASNYQVDHVFPAGALKNWSDVGEFTQSLLSCCDEGDLRILCKPCHDIYSYAERMGISYDEAALEKELILYKKLPLLELRGILDKHGIDYDSDKKLTKTAAISLLRSALIEKQSDDEQDISNTDSQ